MSRALGSNGSRLLALADLAPTLGADQGEHAGHAASMGAVVSTQPMVRLTKTFECLDKVFPIESWGSDHQWTCVNGKTWEANQPERAPSALPKLTKWLQASQTKPPNDLLPLHIKQSE